MPRDSNSLGGAYALHLQPEGELLAATRECEAAIFAEHYGNTAEQLSAEYSAYEHDTVFLALTDPDGAVTGVARLQVAGALTLKTLVDVTRPPWEADAARLVAAAGIDLERTWDVSTIGVRASRGAAGKMHHAMLMHGLLRVGSVNRMGAFVAILDEHVRALLGRMGLVYYALPGLSTEAYLGSPASTPVYAPFDRFLEVQRQRSPEAYRLVTLGIGLDGLVSPTVADLTLRRPRRELDLRSGMLVPR